MTNVLHRPAEDKGKRRAHDRCFDPDDPLARDGGRPLEAGCEAALLRAGAFSTLADNQSREKASSDARELLSWIAGLRKVRTEAALRRRVQSLWKRTQAQAIERDEERTRLGMNATRWSNSVLDLSVEILETIEDWWKAEKVSGPPDLVEITAKLRKCLWPVEKARLERGRIAAILRATGLPWELIEQETREDVRSELSRLARSAPASRMAAGRFDSRYSLSEALLRWVYATGRDEVTVSDAAEALRGQTCFRESSAVHLAFEMAERLGHLQRLPDPPRKRGRPPSPRFRVLDTWYRPKRHPK